VNYVGECALPIQIRGYGHPRGLHDEQLVRVPLLEHERGERREIRSGGDEIIDNNETKVVYERLCDLGYKL
jgi:hypothetical protein